MQKFERVAIIAKPTGNIAHLVRDLAEVIVQAGCIPVLDEHAGRCFDTNCPFEVLNTRELIDAADVAVALGGDGTMLGASRMLGVHDIPIIGVNAGRLGFIADIVVEDMHRIIPAMLNGNYVRDERPILEGSVFRDGEKVFQERGVNDIGIAHGRALGMVEYTVYVDGLQMAVQRADGILVSSSTGSTAYAMAAGGPIMHPSVKSMLLVPVAPHTLSNRPIVLSSSSTIDIEVNETRSAVASFDAQVLFDVTVGDVLRVSVAPNRFAMLHPVGYNHFDLLRRKLKWNYLPQADKPIHTPEHPYKKPQTGS